MTRATRWDRALALRDRLFLSSAAPLEAERALLDAVLDRFALDRLRYSDILEWSLSAEEAGLDTARFSYAFPGYVHGREVITRTALAWADGLGEAASRAARGVMRAARHRAVEQVLVGYARGIEGRPRAKFYLQFSNRADREALELARTMIGTKRATSSDALPLHLLGLDVGSEGLVGAKLYFADARHEARIDGFARPLRNVLWIHRLGHPEDPGFDAPCEIDFGLADNNLSWEELAASPALAPHARGREVFAELGASFCLRARRVSLSLDGGRKLNLYYVLDEADRESGTNPPGGG